MGERAVAGRAGDRPVRYRIVVRGEFTSSRTGPLEGLSVRSAGRFSVLSGEITDQSQLLGILNWLGSRGIEIVSLMPEDPEETGDTGG